MATPPVIAHLECIGIQVLQGFRSEGHLSNEQLKMGSLLGSDIFLTLRVMTITNLS